MVTLSDGHSKHVARVYYQNCNCNIVTTTTLNVYIINVFKVGVHTCAPSSGEQPDTEILA